MTFRDSPYVRLFQTKRRLNSCEILSYLKKVTNLVTEMSLLCHALVLSEKSAYTIYFYYAYFIFVLMLLHTSVSHYTRKQSCMLFPLLAYICRN